MQSSKLHGSKTWPARTDNEAAVLVRWMCDVKAKSRVSSKELRERLEIRHTINAIAKHVVRLTACVAKGRQ